MPQVLIYQALGFAKPVFGHVSLILAPDKSKLSKRHGATSVGEFREDGFLAAAMLNYLSLLGWNDGSEQEIYSVEQLQQAFSLERITKSAAGEWAQHSAARGVAASGQHGLGVFSNRGQESDSYGVAPVSEVVG